MEESVLPRLYREAPLNSIWEGSGNVIALDLLRAIRRNPEVVEAFITELDRGAGLHPGVDTAIGSASAALRNADGDEASARRLAEQLAMTWAATLLVQHGDPDVSDLYVQSRLNRDWGTEFGTLPPSATLRQIADRAVPAVS